MPNTAERAIFEKQLPSGYWLIRRDMNNWTQVPYWPCKEEVIRAYAFQDASEEFLREVILLSGLRYQELEVKR